MKMSNDLMQWDSFVGSPDLTLRAEDVPLVETLDLNHPHVLVGRDHPSWEIPGLNPHLRLHQNVSVEIQLEVNLVEGCPEPKMYALMKYWGDGMELNRLPAHFHPWHLMHMHF